MRFKQMRACVHRSNQSRLATAISLVILGLAMTTGPLQAAPMGVPQDAGDQQTPAGPRQMPSVDDQLQHLKQELNLTDDQQAKIKPILEEQRKQMEAIRNDSSGSRRDRFSKMREIHNNTTSQVREILNDDQKKKYDEMQEHMREEGRKRMKQR